MGRRSEARGRWVVPLFICAPLLLAFTRCGPGGQGGTPPKPVTAPAGPEIKVETGRDVPIRASARGADNYEWQLEGEGRISAETGESVIFTPPDHEGTARLTVRASNKFGTSPKTFLTISVLVEASTRLDTVGLPAGWMSGGGAPEQFISLEGWRDGCRTPEPCLRLTYKSGGMWAGVCWWPDTCGTSGTPVAWGLVKSGRCGIDLPRASGLKEINRLTFWAKGEQGRETAEFKVGASDIQPRPGRTLGLVTLKTNWTRYEIDLKEVDLSNATGLFFWLATDHENPRGATFYLDDIKFEGVK
jgi:hypothetical protein